MTKDVANDETKDVTARTAAGSAAAPLVVTGTVASSHPDVRPGDVLVATEFSAVTCASAPLLTGELRRAGRRVRAGTLADLGVPLDEPVVAAALRAARPDRPTAVVLTAGSADGNADDDADPDGAVGRAIGAWRAALGPRAVLLAEPRSFCAGVDRAIEIVERLLDRGPHPVYVRKEIVHNTHVVRDLAARGAVFVEELDEVPQGATVVFSAHGVSPAVRRDAELRGLDVYDATCPLVSKVHAEVRRYAARGDRIYLIGHAGHEESEGTIGEAPEQTVLVQTADDVAALPDDEGNASYVMQTTLGADEADSVAAALHDRFPGIRGPGSDDICYATTNRQNAVREVAAQADLVLVVGSANSSNSVRLVERSEAEGTKARLVEDLGDVPLGLLAGAGTVGVTAGASAAPALVEEIVAGLRALGPVRTQEVRVATETVTFGLPSGLGESTA
ncbi:4-hydroxy-3-methylbut-2-enyl diphosphate reductase [Streptomyces sp. NBC_01257]|uniref:4-hydroxy-3-methylbut-2-enyl diphosphate reductase n=1 Tax=Streptomyces sp. NBC_01257 TaxID=2903799 RepID=UPI002DDB0B78|nr:4-hydroxy-3-methylbut-2-enyl diphosphate reductase [Streptomyces sp. NBC_01257]WRZ68309.1 4-hydroxy-3-methylbut-2-enyl diphosphate reductase [Streptomyces sp. NBC_01257]